MSGGRPRIWTDDLNVPDISKITLFTAVTDSLGYLKLCAWWKGEKCSQRPEIISAHVFLDPFVEMQTNVCSCFHMTKREFCTVLTQNYNPCSSHKLKNSRDLSPKGKSSQLCSGIKMVCFWLISWSLEQPSHHRSTVKYHLNCTMLLKIKNTECWCWEWFSFMITHPHKLLAHQNNSKFYNGRFFIICPDVVHSDHIPQELARVSMIWEKWKLKSTVQNCLKSQMAEFVWEDFRQRMLMTSEVLETKWY